MWKRSKTLKHVNKNALKFDFTCKKRGPYAHSIRDSSVQYQIVKRTYLCRSFLVSGYCIFNDVDNFQVWALVIVVIVVVNRKVFNRVSAYGKTLIDQWVACARARHDYFHVIKAYCHFHFVFWLVAIELECVRTLARVSKSEFCKLSLNAWCKHELLWISPF